MNIYPFIIDNSKYYFVSSRQSSKINNDKYDIAEITPVIAKLAELYPSKGLYDYSFNLAPGTILSSNFSILYEPSVAYVPDADRECSWNKCKYIDGTYINVYKIGRRTFLGTKNSWDISRMNDLYSRTYLDLFQETLIHVNGSADMPKTGSYIFSNPKIHLLAKDYALCDFSSMEETEDENYIKYYPELGCYTEVVCDDLTKALKALYMDRNKFRQIDDRLSLVSCMLKVYCMRDEYGNYLAKNKCLNYFGVTCVRFFLGLRRSLRKCKIDRFFSVTIPKKMNKDMCFSVQYLPFWNNVVPKQWKS